MSGSRQVENEESQKVLRLNQARMYTAKCKPKHDRESCAHSFSCLWEFLLASRLKRGGVEK